MTLGALYWLFSRAGFGSVLDALHGSGIWLVAAAVLAHLVAFGVGCLRCRLRSVRPLARGPEMNIGLVTFFAVVPIVFVISSLPISVGGFIELHRHLAPLSPVES